MNRIMKLLSLAVLLLVSTGVGGTVVEAKSVSHTYIAPISLFLGEPGAFWVQSDAPNVTVSYEATITNADTGAVISDGATVPVGTRIKIGPKPHESSDIYWFATGYMSNTPYGDWGTAVPNVSCQAKDLMDTVAMFGYNLAVYVPAVVAPPTKSISQSSNLSCGAVAGDGSKICTITAAGAVTAAVSYGATTGTWYSNYKRSDLGVCRTSGTGATSGPSSRAGAYGGTPTIDVPTKSISFAFNAVQPNAPPAVPTLTCPSTGLVGQSLSFTARAADPEGDQVRYGLNWTGATTVTQWAPASGTVPSNSVQTVTKSWATAGTYQLRGLAQDDNGANSAWATGCSVTITNPLPTALLTATPTSVVSGGASTLQWSSTNATSCSINQGVGAVTPVGTGTRVVYPTVNTTYTLTCTGPGGTATDTAVVTVLTESNLTASGITPTSASAGESTAFRATVTNNGTGNAGSTQTRFQRATSAAGASAITLGDVFTSAANVGVSRVVTYTGSLSAGTWYLRACADSTNLAAESNEGDNCGAWTRVTVTDPTPPTLSCTVSDTSVEEGDTVTYTATPSSTALGPYTWTPSSGSVSGSGATLSRTLTVAGNHGMGVRGSNTPTAQCPLVSVSATWCATGTPVLTITATPDRVRVGGTSTVAWSATGVIGNGTVCTVSGPGVSSSQAVSAAPQCSIPNGSATPTITTQSTYTITCGASSKSVIVNVIPEFREF